MIPRPPLLPSTAEPYEDAAELVTAPQWAVNRLLLRRVGRVAERCVKAQLGGAAPWSAGPGHDVLRALRERIGQ